MVHDDYFDFRPRPGRVRDRGVMRALEAATDGLMQCLARAADDPRKRNPGLYCCGKCSVGLWRNVLSGGLDRREERLRRGALHLRSVRDGKHGWRKFPFWYTVLALSEMDSSEATAELKYAAPALERAERRTASSGVYARRRQQLAAAEAIIDEHVADFQKHLLSKSRSRQAKECPERVSGALRARPAMRSGSTGSAAITVSHFGHSELPMRIATGPPWVSPCRTPPITSNSSASNFIRAPRP